MKNTKTTIKALSVITTIVFFLTMFFLTSCIRPKFPGISTKNTYQAQEKIIQNTIAVTGQGKVTTLPDETFINISVIIEKPTTQEAVSTNSQISKQIIEAIQKTNAKDLKIQTIAYELTPLYDYSKENQPPSIYAYQVTSTIEVRTTDLEKISEIIAKATESGAGRISAIGFDLTDQSRKNAKNDALAKATVDAKDKASAIAKSLGLNIDSILYISESETTFPGPLYDQVTLEQLKSTQEEVTPPVIMPQEIEVTATISVVYLFKK